MFSSFITTFVANSSSLTTDHFNVSVGSTGKFYINVLLSKVFHIVQVSKQTTSPRYSTIMTSKYISLFLHQELKEISIF
jgi:hypothetical protein